MKLGKLKHFVVRLFSKSIVLLSLTKYNSFCFQGFEMGSTTVADAFAMASILITGFTGFVGKCLVWKILLTCPEIKNIFVLVRANKNMTAAERFENIVNSFPFSQLSGSLVGKIIFVEGELTTDFSAHKLIEPVDVVIHAASSVNFEESLNKSVDANVSGCQNLLNLCCSFLKPKLFVYISTAYAHCDQSYELPEKVFPVTEKPADIISTFR